MGSFVFKWPHAANEVYVTGTFDDWGKTEKLEKVGDVFQKEVTLKDADKKYLYKFVVDGQWINDHEAPQEDDGHNNVNNVLHPEHIKKAPATLSSAAPESSTAALAGGVPLSNATHSTAPGAFPETPANEAQPSFGVAPIPASEGVGNPAHEGATAKTVESSATTSKEAYDNAGSSDFPGDGTNFSVNPIPASEGIGNPVSTKPGEGLPENVKSASTVDSTVTTSKEDYEKAGSYGLPAAGAAIGGALAAGAAALGFGSKEENKKNLIPESSLPMGDAAGSGGDAGPHIQSAGPQSTTAALAGAVPLEKDRAAGQANISSAAPESTTAALAGSVPVVDTKAADSVPETVKESLAESGQSAEAAASPDAVKEKSALEKELLQKTSTVESTGESAKEAIAGQSSHGGLAAAVPDTVEKSMEKAGAAPEAAADSSVVAEKTAVERELAGKVSKTDATGEPAPVVSAETSAVAPAATGATAAAGAAAVGAAGIGAAGIGAAGIASADKTVPGASNHAAAAISDGADDGEQVEAPKHTTTTERTEADETEYAPPPTSSTAPGVSSGAAAAVSDGADDGLADEPAVKMMNQNETGDVAAVDGAKDEKPTETATEAAKPAAADTTTTSTPAATKPKEETKSTAPTSATSTPTKKPAETPESSPAGKDKKKKHRISSFFKKILN